MPTVHGVLELALGKTKIYYLHEALVAVHNCMMSSRSPPPSHGWPPSGTFSNKLYRQTCP